MINDENVLHVKVLVSNDLLELKDTSIDIEKIVRDRFAHQLATEITKGVSMTVERFEYPFHQENCEVHHAKVAVLSVAEYYKLKRLEKIAIENLPSGYLTFLQNPPYVIKK